MKNVIKHIGKDFMPVYYIEDDGKIIGPFSTSDEAHEALDQPAPPAGEK